MDMIGELHNKAALPPRAALRFLLGRSLGGIRARSRRIREEKYLLAPAGIESRFHDRSFIDYAIPEDNERGPKEIYWVERKAMHIR